MRNLILICVTFLFVSIHCQTCTTDDDCGLGGVAYCSKPIGECSGTGQCAKFAEICTEQYEPVCGCDGVTYGNACSARSSIAHQGECRTSKVCLSNSQCEEGFFCSKDTCGGEGVCTITPEFCTMLYQPVCGCDGKMYGNPCVAASSGQSISSDSSCMSPKDTCNSNSDCQSGFFCNLDNVCGGDGTCEAIPEFCAEYYSRTCGCDGQVYSSRCDAHGNGVSVAPCPEDNSSTIVTLTVALVLLCAVWLL